LADRLDDPLRHLPAAHLRAIPLRERVAHALADGLAEPLADPLLELVREPRVDALDDAPLDRLREPLAVAHAPEHPLPHLEAAGVSAAPGKHLLNALVQPLKLLVLVFVTHHS